MFISAKKHGGFTLIELLITLTIFAVIAMVSMTALMNGLRTTKRIQAQVSLYSEAQALMDFIAKDIQENTVDYEAYYARHVLGETGWETANYGFYAMTFFDPKDGGWMQGPYLGGEDWYGAECAEGGSYPQDCDLAAYNHNDLETGAHPFPSIENAFDGYSTDEEGSMNAFCEGPTRYGSAACADFEKAFSKELILVNAAGDHRIVYRTGFAEAGAGDRRLYRLALDGTDTDGDGLVDGWLCSKNYACAGTVPTEEDFVAFSPLSLSILAFNVLIAPFEDPYRAFAEEDVQVQPQLTFVLELEAGEELSQGLLGAIPQIILQRTVSTQLYSKILSHQ